MTEAYFVLLIAGVMLIAGEVFIPDGVLGVLGGLSLLAAATLGFVIFPPTIAGFAMLGMILLVCAALFLWIRIFPKTPVGKRMMVSKDLKDAHATDESLPALLGAHGITTSPLRPGGYAEINGRRIDVISQGDMIAAGTEIEVVRVEGNNVFVEPTQKTAESVIPNP